MILSALRRAAEPLLRWVFHLYWRFSRGITLGVRGVVIDERGCVFLVKHSYIEGWHLPGGGVEPGETARDALTRELKEEGNIELKGPAQLHGVFFQPRVSQRDHIVCFIVRAFHQPAPPRPNHEITAHGFFAVDAMPDGATSGTRARVAEIFGAAPISEQW